MKGEARGNAAGMRCVVTAYLLAKRGLRDEHGSEGCQRAKGGRSESFSICLFAPEATCGLDKVSGNQSVGFRIIPGQRFGILHKTLYDKLCDSIRALLAFSSTWSPDSFSFS